MNWHATLDISAKEGEDQMVANLNPASRTATGRAAREKSAEDTHT